ncbi:MAG TPA: hypothetical protein VNJ12_07120 [Candidatus Dormibacteraeota bacterium]|nr:hypothetical protein [Candidatus Dormibacteraeota bacterium]
MPVPKEDWLKDTVWSEAHLTLGGWLRGTTRTEKGRFENEVAPPSDCLMTVRSLDLMPSNPKEKPKAFSEIRWRLDDVELIERAQANLGVLPRRAPPLSHESASKHSILKNLALMQLSESRRPVGKIVGEIERRRGW